ncbi:hypothetical protein QTG54_010699 [Skeletonema marinoi]|uniref:Uncharacterized protein n=1 Tax=Skeletonema marinoi TaxID=267567 RepID=A0AAD8Y2Y0_9STRA|nr:hypothetical protein QTG54_010699 [Skeletonema marinoi]
MKVSTLLAISALAHPCSVTSFVVPTTPLTTHVTSSSPTSSASTFGQTSLSQLSMAGFGGGGGGGSKKNKKAVKTLPKLKAKTQWDRYADLKQCKKVIVGVKIVGGEEEEADWLEVGKVRSDNDEHTLVAIANQRALIADHAKRLYPVKVPANSVLEWGYFLEGEEEGSWVTVDKASGADAPKGIEKKFGFEGISDKASGFYCYYSEGRVVERGETLASNLTTGSKTLPN